VSVFLLVLLFIVVPLVELYVIIQVGGWIGALPTIGLLLLDSILGAVLLRSQGRAVWRRFNQALAEGRVPHRETFDGVMVIFGGALLLTPGFITDIVGLLLLIPPTRALIRRGGTLVVMRRFALGGRVAYWGYSRMPRRPTARRRPRSNDVEGTAQEVPEEPAPPAKDTGRSLPP
jgi:UPF0716 protein FxsA